MNMPLSYQKYCNVVQGEREEMDFDIKIFKMIFYFFNLYLAYGKSYVPNTGHTFRTYMIYFVNLTVFKVVIVIKLSS